MGTHFIFADEDVNTLQKVLKVIASKTEQLQANVQQQLLAQLNAKLGAFDSPPDLIAEMITTLYRVTLCFPCLSKNVLCTKCVRFYKKVWE